MFRDLLRFDKRYLLLLVPVLRFVVPWVQYRTSMMLATFFFIVWICSMYFLRRERCICVARLIPSLVALMFFLSVYHALPFVFHFIGFGTPIRTVREVVKMVIWNLEPALIVYFSLKFQKLKELKVLTIFIMLGFILTGVNAFRHGDAMMEIGSGRAGVGLTLALSQGEELSNELVETLVIVRSGLVDFAGSYVCALSIPLLVYLTLKSKGWKMRCLPFVAILGCLSSIRSSGLGTPALVYTMGTLFCLALVILRFRWIVVVMAMMAGMCMIVFSYRPTMFSFLAPPIQAVAESVEAPQFKTRLESIAEALARGQDTYALSRSERQRRSLDSFLKAPILGTVVTLKKGSWSNDALGGHSELMDKLGAYGLLGILVIVGVVASFWRFIYLSACYLPFRAVKELKDLRIIFLCSLFVASIANPVYIFHGIWYVFIVGLCIVGFNDRVQTYVGPRHFPLR